MQLIKVHIDPEKSSQESSLGFTFDLHNQNKQTISIYVIASGSGQYVYSTYSQTASTKLSIWNLYLHKADDSSPIKQKVNFHPEWIYHHEEESYCLLKTHNDGLKNTWDR